MIPNYREINLITVSEYASEILAENKLKINHLDNPTFTEVLDQVWDLYPRLYHEEDYTIYWRCSPRAFVEVCDFYSYHTALTLMTEGTFYLILRDSDPWSFGENPLGTCRDVEILLEALEERPCPKYFTQSYRQIFRVIQDAKRGYPKLKLAPIPPDDNVINQRPKVQVAKGKGDKGKDKKDKKKK